MLNKKGEILLFIKQKPRTTKEISVKFGNGGLTWVNLDQLIQDKIIFKPRLGHWEYVV